MKVCDACGEVGYSQPTCAGAVCHNPLAKNQLEQALSEGPLRQDELPTQWWNRYIIDGNRLCIGYDLTCWALPLKVSIGRYDINISILCFDIGYYFGEIHW